MKPRERVDGKRITKREILIFDDGRFTTRDKEVISRYNEKGYLFKNRSDFLKTFMDKPYPDELTWAEKGRLGRLEHELKDGQLLAYISSSSELANRIQPHTITTISKIIDCSERQTKAFIKKCKDLQIIGEAMIENKKYYLLNPRYKLHGTRVSLTTFFVFRKTLEKDIPEWAFKKFIEDLEEKKPNIIVLD